MKTNTNKLKNIINKLISPNKLLSFLLFNFSLISLIYIFLNKQENTIIAYITYPISFYTLLISSISTYQIIIKLNKKINNNKLYHKYKTNINFKIKTSLYFNIFMNILYGIINLISGISLNSYWFITLATYYLLLSLMRIIILINISKTKSLIKEYQILKYCGIILLFMNLIFSGIITLTIKELYIYKINEYLIYLSALYNFYLIITAIINVIKYYKNKRPLFTASKYINLTVAMISMLSLETTMLIHFQTNNSTNFNFIMISLTGLTICIINSYMAISMIINSNKHFKK